VIDNRVPLLDLDIVGYADTLTPDLLPRVVAPIYRRRSQPDQFLLPPFRIEEGSVVGFVRSDGVDFEQAIAEGRATRIETIPAIGDHQLWIDRDSLPRYEPRGNVAVYMRTLAKEEVRNAKEALKKGDYEEASRLAQVALAADERCLDALLVKAIVQRRLERQEEVEVLREIAEVVAPNIDFQSWVDLYAPSPASESSVLLPSNASRPTSRVGNASERQDLNRLMTSLSTRVADVLDRNFVVGPSRVGRDIIDLVHKIAKLSASVLILGESGTGKELLARLIHRESGKPDAPFIAVNLAAIPGELAEITFFGHERGAFAGAHRTQPGKFELASHGTLFLDEIGDLRLDLQATLLRAIQEGEIKRVGGAKPIKTEFRLIAATNIDLAKAVQDGRFREDLYYRLNVIPILLPPLRERTEDIPQLADFFLRRYNTRFRKHVQGITDSTMVVLKQYWWPGNIRELENLIERLVAVGDKDYISEDDLPLEFHFSKFEPQAIHTESLFEDATASFERNFVLRALEKCDWNTTATAEYLGIPLSTLKYKMDKLDVRQLAKRLRGA